MKGFITAAINEREYPSVDAPVLGFYNEGAIVDVVGRVQGDEYDGESLWYQLSNGAFLWSEGVNVERDCSGLPMIERQQFLLCYRKTDGVLPRLDTRSYAETLTVSNLVLPSSILGVQLREIPAALFANSIIQSLQGIDPSRKHVVLYIHGYQLISSLKLDLLSNFVMSYLTHENNKIAKAIFFSWPSQGGPARKTVDDRSIRAGQDFTKNNLFIYLATLSAELKKAGLLLDLVVHSFGHQLLNGMLNPGTPEGDALVPGNVFENVFLMASDVTHLVFKKEGIKLKNYYQDSLGEDYQYGFQRLKTVAKKVHVFYDEEDFLLYVSTKKFVEKGLTKNISEEAKMQVRDYRSLGNYGSNEIPETLREDGFNYYSIQDLCRNSGAADMYDFPFQSQKKKIVRIMKTIRGMGDYGGINVLRILFNSGRFTNRHRYLFTCKPVVDKVQELLT
jgi:hypothetical protein